MDRRSHGPSWTRALLWGAALTGAILATAVAGNLALGRTIHWDIVAGIGIAGLVSLTVSRRAGLL